MNFTEKLTQYKLKNNFPLHEWEERGLNPSKENVIQDMNQEIHQFTKHLLENSNSSNLENCVQVYFNNWNRKHFDTEEMEFIFDIFFEIILKIGIDVNSITP